MYGDEKAHVDKTFLKSDLSLEVVKQEGSLVKLYDDDNFWTRKSYKPILFQVSSRQVNVNPNLNIPPFKDLVKMWWWKKLVIYSTLITRDLENLGSWILSMQSSKWLSWLWCFRITKDFQLCVGKKSSIGFWKRTPLNKKLHANLTTQ